ncbi:translesion error-prone DNA polymerase V autoproteolytic subunit [bacterium]|nr:translesion error-prone DNA polymerase V autoproteolytic subunit [bacterium]
MNKESKSNTNIPLMDNPISAGFPGLAQGNESSSLNLHDLLVENKTATYFIRVKGDSMEGAGIFDNDILVVDRSKEIATGKIVIASLNGEFTVKRLEIQKNTIFLHAENPKYRKIAVTKDCDFEIFGVVTYNIHRQV